MIDLHAPNGASAAGISDVGRRRSDNQDAMVVRNDVCLWAVADGMGGHQRGQWAAGQIKSELDALSLTADFNENCRRISAAVHAANTTIAAAGEESGATIGSTVVVLHCLDSQFVIFWAGDSRVYLLRRNELVRMTTDHTQVQEMIDGGLLKLEEAAHHPDRSVLSRAVGVASTLTLDAMLDVVEPDDRFLLCSDGLTGVVSDGEIGKHLGGQLPSIATKELLELVLSRGAPDNVTIVAVHHQRP